MIDDELRFPFNASFMGQTIRVVDMKWPENESYGLDLVCVIEDEQHCIEARSVELLPRFPEGHQFLAAYLDWKSRL